MSQQTTVEGLFFRQMRVFGPFEPNPVLVVAVSGGADSMALVLLAEAWTRENGGRVIGLTVDHGLRPEAVAEAVQVGQWLAARGIEHHILTRTGLVFTGDVQAQAREARYALLTQWCRLNGVLHLLLAHHQDDQAETFLLRLARGSGVQGLSAMAALSYGDDCRLLRPLLGVSKQSLVEWLRGKNQEWIEDPSNQNPSFARVRMRGLSAALAAEGLTPSRLAATALQLGRAREAVETAVDELLARCVTPHAGGWLVASLDPLRHAAEEIALRALGRMIAVVGGNDYTPRLESVERCYQNLGTTMTVGGARFRPQTDGKCLLVRESRHLPTLTLKPGDSALWDGRFRVSVALESPHGVTVSALGNLPVPGISRATEKLQGLPAAARATIPVLKSHEGLVYVPFFEGDTDKQGLFSCVFSPKSSLTSARFHLAL